MSIKKTVEGTLRTLHQHGMRLQYAPWHHPAWAVKDSMSTMGWSIPARVAQSVIKHANVKKVRTWVTTVRGKDGRMHSHECCEYKLFTRS